MKILVTGGAGFIGSHTVVELVKIGYKPIIIDNFSNSEKWIIGRIAKITGIKPVFYEGNCADKNFLQIVIKKEKNISAIIHFAGLKAVNESLQKPLQYYQNNIVSSIALLEKAIENKINNFIFSSSATVYGNPKKNPLSEKSLRQPAVTPYGNTKIIIEDIIRDTVYANNSLSALSLRYFNPIGAHPSGLIGELPKGTPNNLLPYLIQVATGQRKTLTIFGDDYPTPDGTGMRDFIHVVDLAKAHIASLKYLEKQKRSFYDVFNVGTGSPSSVKELITAFEEVNKVKIPYKIGPRRKGDIAACWADPKKINQRTGWRAERTIKDALEDAYRWQKNLKKKH
jgi:UDP-glucose 4-epimerase